MIVGYVIYHIPYGLLHLHRSIEKSHTKVRDIGIITCKTEVKTYPTLLPRDTPAGDEARVREDGDAFAPETIS